MRRWKENIWFVNPAARSITTRANNSTPANKQPANKRTKRTNFFEASKTALNSLFGKEVMKTGRLSEGCKMSAFVRSPRSLLTEEPRFDMVAFPAWTRRYACLIESLLCKLRVIGKPGWRGNVRNFMNCLKFDRLRSLKVLVLAAGISGLLATPAFGFVFGEHLPQSPPGTGVSEPPPIFDQGPPDWTQDGPPINDIPGDTPPPIDNLASAPEPATLIAGLFGVGLVGVIGAWRRRQA